MKRFPLVALTVIFSATAIFALFGVKVPAGFLRFNFKAPGINLEGEMRKEEMENWNKQGEIRAGSEC